MYIQQDWSGILNQAKQRYSGTTVLSSELQEFINNVYQDNAGLFLKEAEEAFYSSVNSSTALSGQKSLFGDIGFLNSAKAINSEKVTKIQNILNENGNLPSNWLAVKNELLGYQLGGKGNYRDFVRTYNDTLGKEVGKIVQTERGEMFERFGKALTEYWQNTKGKQIADSLVGPLTANLGAIMQGNKTFVDTSTTGRVRQRRFGGAGGSVDSFLQSLGIDLGKFNDNKPASRGKDYTINSAFKATQVKADFLVEEAKCEHEVSVSRHYQPLIRVSAKLWNSLNSHSFGETYILDGLLRSLSGGKSVSVSNARPKNFLDAVAFYRSGNVHEIAKAMLALDIILGYSQNDSSKRAFDANLVMIRDLSDGTSPIKVFSAEQIVDKLLSSIASAGGVSDLKGYNYADWQGSHQNGYHARLGIMAGIKVSLGSGFIKGL